MGRTRTLVSLGLFVVAAVLLVDHILTRVGFYDSPDPGFATYNFAPLNAPDDAISPSKFGPRTESNLAFVRRANQIVNLTTYHCEPDDFRLSLIEQAVVAVRSQADVFSEGLLTERMSCGFCHQRAYRLVRALRDAGLKAHVFGIGGHVVARVRVDGKDYAADPDFGIGPFPWSEDRDTLIATVKRAYQMTFVPLSDQIRASFPDMYASIADNGPYRGLGSRDQQQQDIFFQSTLAFYAMLLLNLVAVWYLYRSRKHNLKA